MTTHAIKTATQAVIRAVGGVDAAASFVRVGRSQLSDYQNRHSQSVVPVDVAIEMDRCAQEPIILPQWRQLKVSPCCPSSLEKDARQRPWEMSRPRPVEP